MVLSAIVALDEKNAIGHDNQLPWHLPEDLKFFKRTTTGKPILMGRKTYESLGRPLPNRLNIVISRQQDLQLPEGVLLYSDLQEGIKRLEEEGTEEGFVIGGGHVFTETINQLDRLYITVVHTVVNDAEVFFPHIDHAHWKLVWDEAHPADDKHAYAYTFQQWERVKEI